MKQVFDFLAADPMEQFVIQPLVQLPNGSNLLAFTNSSLWMVITITVGIVFFFTATSAHAR